MAEDNWFLNGHKVIKRQMLSKSSQQIINGISISLESSFGCLQAPIRRNAYFVSDDVMMFLSGKHIVMYDIIRRRQSYIMKPGEDEQVQALNFCVTNGKTLLIALAFRSTSKILPTVKVYNRQKQRFYQLVHSHLLPNSLVFEVAFLNNGKNLVTLTRSEEGYGITVFQVTKEIAVQFHTIKAQLSFIECLSPNGDEFLVGGPTFLTMYSFSSEVNLLDEECNFYEMITGLHPNETLIDCAALAFDKVKVLVTSMNRLVLLKDKRFIGIRDCYIEDPSLVKVILKDQPVKQEQKSLLKPKISTISKTAKGFVVGMIGRPILEVFDYVNDDVVFRGSYLVKNENIYGIHQVHLAADEMFAAITVVYFNKSAFAVANGQSEDVKDTPSCETIIDRFQGKVELFTFNLAIVEALKTVQKDPFEPLFEKGVHRGSILNLAMSPMRAVIASVCEDKTCKFWDYSNDFKELFSHQFHETPNCVALHPLSFLCVIGFKEGMRLYYVLDDDLKLLYTENMKNCNAVAFSEGGQYLAASNTTNVSIFHPLKLSHIYTFQNHQSNLKELYFAEKDLFLVTVCQLGVLYVWNMQTMQRPVEHSQKANKYNAVVYDSYHDLVVGACADHKIKVYTEKGQTLALEQDTSPTLFTSICVSLRYGAIFFGTSQGSIRIYSYPFYHFNPKTMEYIEVPVHQAAVTQIKVSPDTSYLITSSADGSIFFSKIKQFQNGIELSQLDLLTQGDLAGKFTNTFALNSLSLSSRMTKEQRKDNIKELDYQLQNFKSDIDDEKERLITLYNGQIKELEDSNQAQLNALRDELSSTIQTSDQQTTLLKQKIHDFKKDHKEMLRVHEEEQSTSLLKYYDQRDQLQTLLNMILDKQRQQKESGLKEYESTLQQVDEEYLRKYQELYQRFTDAMINMKSDQRKFKEVLQQGEKEYETFYKESQLDLQSKLAERNSETEDLRKSISKFTKENERLQHRREFLRGLIKDTTNQVQNLEHELANYQEKHTNMMQQLEEKEDLINQREQQIKDFRMKNVHLQNFQKVYDYRVNTLKDEREPLLEHLKNMDKHVKNLYNELIEEAGLKQQYELDRTKCETGIDELKQRLGGRFKQASISKRKIDVINYEITKLLSNPTNTWTQGLNTILKSIQIENGQNFALSGSIFEETMKDMQKDPIQEQMDRITQNNIQKELTSQKGFLQKKLVNVQASVKHSIEERHQTYYSVQSTNTQLINECNRLRDTKQRLKEHIDKQTKAFREIKRELHYQGVEMTENPEQVTSFEEPIELEEEGQQVVMDNYVSKKTPFAQYEEQKDRKYFIGSEQPRKFKPQNSTKLFKELYQEVRTNGSDENMLRDRLRQKTNAYLKPSDSATVLPSVLSKSKESKPTIKLIDHRQQLLSAGVPMTRGSKNSTTTNFFLQTHTTTFTNKTPNTTHGKKRPQMHQ